jgi:hypothetical protein
MHRENEEEKEVVIAYASRHLNDVEKNWSTIEKEAYAIVHAVKQFYPYLYGMRFQVLSDHKLDGLYACKITISQSTTELEM